MNRFYLFIIPIALYILNLLGSCQTNQAISFDFNNIYTTKSNEDSFVVKFHHKTDSIYLFYYFTFKNGNYLNYPLDSQDYAGVFISDSIKNKQITIPIKDYRQYWNDTSRIYDVTIRFLSDTTFHWYIDSVKYGILDFLPHNITFRKRN